MVAITDPVKLRRHRRIAWYLILAFFLVGVVLENLGFNGAASIAFILIFLTLIDVLLLVYRIRRTDNEHGSIKAKEDIKLQPYWKIVVGNVMFSGFVLLICSTSALMAGFAGLIVIGVLLPMAVSAGKESHDLRRQRWTRFFIYTIAVSAGLLLDHQAREDEQRNFNNIIVSVDQYKSTEGRYPDKLEQLLPKYLAGVPNGRRGKFVFSASGTDNATLTHTIMPFVHESYDFKSKTRRTWD